MRKAADWDPELYEAKHSFVWQFGQDLVKLLEPTAGERILDLGCGTGNLTKRIAQTGAEVVGIDLSAEMIGQARRSYPALNFVLGSAATMEFSDEFDAVFSNAALHWMLDAEAVARGIARGLKPNGRFVAELGGKGNIAAIEGAIQDVLKEYLPSGLPAKRTHYPSMGEYVSLLERHGIETRFAQVFDRPTKLEGTNGMETWLRQFKWYYFEAVPNDQREEALADVIQHLRSTLWNGQGWIADYRRLRIRAIKL